MSVTSNPYADVNAIRLTDESFKSGTLKLISYARPGKLFTASQNLMTAQAGKLKEDVLNSIVDSIVHILQAEATV